MKTVKARATFKTVEGAGKKLASSLSMESSEREEETMAAMVMS